VHVGHGHVIVTAPCPGLGFAACSGTCTSGWPHVLVDTTVTWGETILALDGQGNPRISASVNKGGSNLVQGELAGCEVASCTSSAQSWHSATLSSAADWLALDASGNPRVAGFTTGGVSYRVCTAGCTSASPTWQDTLVPDTAMNAADPKAHGSLADYWREGGSLALALDAAGDAWIVNDGRRYPWDTAATGAGPDAYGVFLRKVSAQ
jgi:hypothetical protein